MCISTLVWGYTPPEKFCKLNALRLLLRPLLAQSGTTDTIVYLYVIACYDFNVYRHPYSYAMQWLMMLQPHTFVVLWFCHVFLCARRQMVYLQNGGFLPNIDKLCSNCRNFQVSFEITTSTKSNELRQCCKQVN